MSRLVLSGGTVLSEPFAPPRNASVTIEGETIVAIADSPIEGPAIDCSGCTIVAGFWNAHVHFFERKWASASDIPGDDLQAQLDGFLRYGFTSVFDLSSSFANTAAIRARIDSGDVRGPSIFTTGEGLVPSGFTLPDLYYRLMGQIRAELPQVGDADDARASSRALLERGVDAIKLFASAPGAGELSVATMKAAVEEARRVRRPVFVHPNTADDVVRAVAAGADVIAHTTPSGVWPDDVIASMRAADVAVIPTLHLWEYFARHDRHAVAEAQTAAAVEQVRAWRAAGGAMLFGTDAGAVGLDPRPEFRLLERSGIGFDALLESLTTAPASRFTPMRAKGRVAPGSDADIVVLDGPPCIDALHRVRMTVRKGKIVHGG